jgi:hypothetical protein
MRKQYLQDKLLSLMPSQWEEFLFRLEEDCPAYFHPSQLMTRLDQVAQLIDKVSFDVLMKHLRNTVPCLSEEES